MKGIITILLLSVSGILSAQWQDWKFQVCKCVNVATTPANPNNYSWQLEIDDVQGVHIHLGPTEVVDIYVEANNSKIDFCFWLCGSAINSLIHLEVNIDNSGFQQLYNGSPKLNHVWDCRQAFPQPGNHNLKVKYIESGGSTIYFREYNIIVVPKSDKLFRDQFDNTMRVWKSSQSNSTPIVLSPGFDSYNTKPEQYYRGAGAKLFNCLLENGYDIYVLYYKYNPQDLRNNAAVYSSAVSYVSETHYDSKAIVAAGISMGGVITRYALAKAESLNDPLPVKTWISLDAPHTGAVINSNLQNTLKTLQSDNFDRYALECEAAQILLKYNTYDIEGRMHKNFYNELTSLNGDGYPHLTHNIGVSFSSPLPNPNNGVWLNISGVGVNINIELETDDKQPGSYLPRLNMDPSVVTVAWGLFWTTVTLNQISDPTFIPHLSALDNYTSNFHDIIVPPVTTNHSVVPTEIINPLLYALRYPKNLFLQNLNLSGTNKYIVRNEIFAGKQIDSSQPIGDVIINPSSNIDFSAGNTITLKDGFHANYNFKASILTPEQTFCNSSDFNILRKENETIVKEMPEKVPLLNESDSEQNTVLKNSSIKIYPNPTNDILNVYYSSAAMKEFNIKIYNLIGGVVYDGRSWSGDNCKIDVSSLIPGIYILQMTSSETVKPIKFIIR